MFDRILMLMRVYLYELSGKSWLFTLESDWDLGNQEWPSLTVMIFFSGRMCSSEAFLLPGLGTSGMSTWEGMVNECGLLALGASKLCRGSRAVLSLVG